MIVTKRWVLLGPLLIRLLKQLCVGLRKKMQPVLEEPENVFSNYERKEMTNEHQTLDGIHDVAHLLRKTARTFNEEAEKLECLMAEAILHDSAAFIPDNVVSLFEDTDD